MVRVPERKVFSTPSGGLGVTEREGMGVTERDAPFSFESFDSAGRTSAGGPIYQLAVRTLGTELPGHGGGGREGCEMSA